MILAVLIKQIQVILNDNMMHWTIQEKKYWNFSRTKLIGHSLPHHCWYIHFVKEQRPKKNGLEWKLTLDVCLSSFRITCCLQSWVYSFCKKINCINTTFFWNAVIWLIVYINIRKRSIREVLGDLTFILQHMFNYPLGMAVSIRSFNQIRRMLTTNVLDKYL